MTGSSSAETGRPLVGIGLVALAVLAFALSDVVTKHLAQSFPVPALVAVRYMVNLALLVAFLYPRGRARLWQTTRTGLVLVRGLCLAAASLTLGLALKFMPVGETIAIIYLSPFAVMLIAIPLLGERVSLVGWIGAAVGFAGVLLIVRPGSGLDTFGVIMALINAGFATAYHLLTRLLTRTESTDAMLFHTAWVGVAVFCVLSLWELDGLVIGWGDLAMMGLLGILATLGHFLFTAAYREAPASLLAPVNYLHLAWAGGLGWLIFGHIPDPLSLTGILLVAGSGASIALFAHFSGRRAASQHAHPE